jgi:uncharacterized protein (DUF362 family)
VVNDPAKTYLNRREFMARSAKAGLAVAATCGAGFLFFDDEGPAREQAGVENVSLPDFSLADAKGRMRVAKGADRGETLGLALKALGGIETFVKKGDAVLLKINAAFATAPALSATTHPDLVAHMSRLCFKAGAKSVVVTDNPINDPASCFALTGIARAAKSAGAKVLLPKTDFFRPTTVPGGRLIKDWPLLYTPFEGIDKVIGLAPVKDHSRSGASMSLKNFYGLLGGRRNIFHQDINTIITELALMIKPTLVILDGTFSMMQNGPTGGSLSDLKATNTMIVSTDPVAADAFGAGLLDKTPQDLPYIGRAAKAGAGRLDYTALDFEIVNSVES